MGRFLRAAMAALALSSCNQAGEQPPAETPIAAQEAEGSSAASFAPVDAALLAAPSEAFMAIEPSEIGVMASETVEQAIEPLTSVELGGEGGAVHVSVRDEGANKFADVVRTELADDSIAAAHVRLEFMPSPEGWFPVNAWRRWQCRRGPETGAWSASPCP